MRMLIGTGILLAIMPTVAAAAERAKQAEKVVEERRCAFLGNFGSFTLIGDTGTAAYRLGKGEYIADLRTAGDDPNWWIYRPTGNGDPSTTLWAFARKPICGKYTVLRFAKGAWRHYEKTDAWGIGLGSSGIRTSSPGPTNQELLDKLREIEGKLNSIQPGSRPSLLEIENQIKAKP